MDELQAQSLVIKAVREGGGFGMKMSNRFLVGVPDLLLCWAGHPFSVWEAKIADFPKRNRTVKLKITPLQAKTLGMMEKAGAQCGIISFLRDEGDLYMAAFSNGVASYGDGGIDKYEIAVNAHKLLRRGERNRNIVEILESVYE